MHDSGYAVFSTCSVAAARCASEARGKDFCKELLDTGKVQVLGYTMYKEMIRLTGTVKPAPAGEQDKWRDLIFEEQPYLANVYPGETRSIGIIFCIRDMSIEYFNLGVNPIFRESYVIGNGKPAPKGYFITDTCISCGKCVHVCPQKAIDKGSPSVIHQEHCLHCGNCLRVCPAGAVEKAS